MNEQDAEAAAKLEAVAAKLRESSTKTSTAKTRSGRKLLHYSPEQWKRVEQTPVAGKVVPSGRILPIRAPLSSLYEIHFAAQTTNTPSSLMEELIAQVRTGTVVNVGLVVDATGNDAFLHDVKEWDDWDVDYVKLRVEIPEGLEEKDRDEYDDKMVAAFFAAVQKHKHGEKKNMDVAVYGAMGYNFPGFLIVSYLVEHCDLSLDSALNEYAVAVPPGIYSKHYLERLYRKYFSTLQSSSTRISCPASPKWDSDATSSDGESIGSEILTEQDQLNKFVRKAPSKPQATTPVGNGKPVLSGGLPGAPVYKAPLYIPPDRADLNNRPAKRRKIRSWMDDVLPLGYGELVDAESEGHQRLAKALEKLTGHEGFPGCEAIPLTATHVANGAYKNKGCLTKSYLVTWRARGRRCLLYVTAEGTYVVSRDMTFTKVEMKFPRRRAPSEFQVNTLIDGVIVEDQDHDNKVSRYLAFDIIFLEGAPIWQKKLEKRLQCLQNEIILPRKNDQSYDYSKEPFRVRMKDHFRLAKTEYLLEKFVKSVTHEVDGVIYTPTEAPYNLGGFESDEPIFKFVASEGGGIPGLDGSIPQSKLLQYVGTIPQK